VFWVRLHGHIHIWHVEMHAGCQANTAVYIRPGH